MATPEIKYNREAQRVFDRDFPPAKVDAFELDVTGSDWVDPFSVLSAFDQPEIKPEGRDTILSEILSHQYGPLIMTHMTKSGLRVYRRNITPFLRASQEVVINHTDLWEQEQREAVDRLYPLRIVKDDHKEEDWRR